MWWSSASGAKLAAQVLIVGESGHSGCEKEHAWWSGGIEGPWHNAATGLFAEAKVWMSARDIEVEHCCWVYGLTVNCHKKGGGVHMSMPANIKNSIEFSCSWDNVGQLEHLLLQPTLDSSLKALTECESTGASPPLGYHMQWWFRPCLWGRHNGRRIRARYVHIYTVTSDFSHKFIYGQEKRKADM